MTIKHAILGLLSQGPRHGYELRSAYENELVPQSKLNAGQVYTTLDRLRREALAEVRHVGQDRRPDRKVYALTPAGREALDHWMLNAAPADLDLRNQVFMKLMLAVRLPDHDPLAVIHQERRTARGRLEEVRSATLKAEADGAPLSITLLLDLAASKLESLLSWLERCERRLRDPR